MPDEAEVKALTEKLASEQGFINVVYDDKTGGIRTSVDFEALARVALARDAKLRAAVKQYVKENCAYVPESFPSVCRHLTDCETCNRRTFARLLGEE